ncbi:MAG: hypothetical protein IJO03_03780 [Clostridia bacterium]|nr:hypothetical protein [Clostridia bacterium]
MTKIISLILSFFTALSLAAEGLPYMFQPTVEIDAAVSMGEVSSRASGYLYGIAQSNVPDSAMTESVDIASVSQKVIGGLQHPIGDVDDAAPALGNCDYITVYLQDCFDTWYYCNDEIWQMRKAGTYDHMDFVRTRFLPQVEEKVRELSQKEYSDKLVYCIYNEADNGVWFGTMSDDGTWLMFDDAAKQRFYEAWKETYNLVKSIDPDARIGGPGNCDYDGYEIKHFLEYCKANNCVPDVMIYHELGDKSSLYWQDHVDDYRRIENELGIDELPIIVTEYGTMYECGAPADMLKYVVQIENSGVYGNMAYWRLANNLNDTAADNNSPNSNWWLFRWYADMEGSLLKSKIIDVLHADFANVIKYGFDRFHYGGFTGIASLTDSKDEINVICGGCDYAGNVCFKNLDETNLGKKVNVRIECVYFEGLSGVVTKPYVVHEYTDTVTLGRLKVKLENIDPTAVYHIVITEAEGDVDYKEALPVRYEFEHGTRSGGSYTYDSAYATTGELQGMVGGLENLGDSVTVNFEIPESGYYDLSLIYGNSNDGRTPADRKDTLATMTVDGVSEEIAFPNTIKSEYTDKMTFTRYFEAGTHTLNLAHKSGTFVVDSLLVVPHSDDKSIAVLKDSDRTTSAVKSFLAVSPDDGFYEMNIGVNADFELDGAEYTAENGNALVYLRRGLNYIDVKTAEDITCDIVKSEKTGFTVSVSASEMTLDGAALSGNYIDGISSLGGSASFKVTVPESGSYRMTLAYANNDEGGVHSYNVDLIERYVTVEANGRLQTLWCRNTYSWDTVKTATINLELAAGENEIVLSNDGSVRFNGRDSYAPHIYGVTVNR